MLGSALAYKTPPDAKEAEKAVREAIRLNPWLLSYTQYQLHPHLLRGNYEEAMAAFDRCEEFSRNSSGAGLGRSQALAAQGRYAEAITIILKRGAPEEHDRHVLPELIIREMAKKEKALATVQEELSIWASRDRSSDSRRHLPSLPCAATHATVEREPPLKMIRAAALAIIDNSECDAGP